MKSNLLYWSSLYEENPSRLVSDTESFTMQQWAVHKAFMRHAKTRFLLVVIYLQIALTYCLVIVRGSRRMLIQHTHSDPQTPSTLLHSCFYGNQLVVPTSVPLSLLL